MTLWPAFLMLALLAINVPVAIAMIAPAFLFFLFGGDLPLDLIAQRIVATTDSFPLLALPFFILAGSIMNSAGITRNLLKLADAFVGHFAGGLAQISVLLATLMGGFTASANADAAMLAKMLGPTMIRRGYAPGFAAAVTACSSIIAVIIPPGIGLIVYAYLANVSVGRLFIAGIVPGIVLTLALLIAVYLVAKRRGYAPIRTRMMSGPELGRTILEAGWALTLPVFIVVGIRNGFFTPTEAGAIAVVYATLIGVFMHRELKWKHVPGIIRETLHTTAVVMLIICAASTFGYYMVWERIPTEAANALVQLTSNPYVMLLLVNILLLFVGMLIEGTAALILLTPILAPVAVKLGIDPIQFGIIMVLNLTLGGVTPPVGTLSFTTSSALHVRFVETVRESLPLLLALMTVLALVTAIPSLSLALPNLVMN
ncbi:TRAP transporter large permease [Chelatococcus sp. GCM10030263]|uniref:TRAP transporter large permease n=1 Tax=Chelatococcus sp. GCM10030263 TaxID=3273387 RepID=UPI00361E56DF